jgi:hypothetical protein
MARHLPIQSHRKEEKTMAKKILVPLGKHDRVEEIIPYIKEVTQPGMSVVFLIHHPVNGFKWLQAYSAIMQCDINNAQAVRRMVESHSAEMNRRLAEQRVFHTCKALHQLGVKISVEVYGGSLRKTLKSYVSNGSVDLIVTRPVIQFALMSLLQGTVAVWSMFQRPSRSPLLGSQACSESTLQLVHPGI